MMSGKNYLWCSLIFIEISSPLLASGQDANELAYTFCHTDTNYSFNASFRTSADPACLLEISFYFEHIQALAPDAKEMTLLAQGSNWNMISYTYRKFLFFENKTTWQRKLDIAKQRVDFAMVSCHNNQAIMPQMISSSGYYQVTEQGGNVIMEYHQECHLKENALGIWYLDMLEKEAIQFIKRLSEYANAFCITMPHEVMVNE